MQRIEQGQVGPIQPCIRHRRQPQPNQVALRLLEGVHGLGSARRGDARQQRIGRAIDEHARGTSVWAAQNLPSCHRRRAHHASLPQGLSVRNDRVAIDALEHHRTVGKQGIELGTVWKRAIVPVVLVPSSATNPSRAVTGVEQIHHLLPRRGTHRVDPIEPLRVPNQMAVGVHQAGVDGLAFCVESLDTAVRIQHLVFLPHGDHASTVNRHRLTLASPSIHGVDGCVSNDEVHLLGRKPAATEQCHCKQGQPQAGVTHLSHPGEGDAPKLARSA